VACCVANLICWVCALTYHCFDIDLPGLGPILSVGYLLAEFQYNYVGMVYPLSGTELQNKINMGADL
jgi:hypothetical protein